MKNKKIKIAYLLTTFIFLFTYIGGLLGNIKSYAYDDYGGRTSKKSIFGGSYYGGYSPFRRVYFGYGISSWIMKLVMLITVIVVIYIIIDYIRSKRD